MIEVKHLEKYYGSDGTVTNAAGSIKLIIQRDDNGHIQSIDVE